jgi:hypothetical protein
MRRARSRSRCKTLISWLVPALLAVVAMPLLAATTQDDWQDVSRIVAIGDIHGDYDSYIAVLKDAGVVNRWGKWAAGQTHLVQVGDIPDRGPDTLKIIRHLQKLEKQAAKAGGRLHLLIGNHEYMNIVGDLRYVHPGEYEAFETRKSKQIRDNYYAYVVKTLQRQRAALPADSSDVDNLPILDDAFKKAWYAEHPLGFVEHRLAWQKGGELFEWVASHNTLIRINDVLFLHAGLSASLLPLSIRDINTRVRAELNRESVEGEPLGSAGDGPLWYRGLAAGEEATEQPALEAILAHYGARMIVLGHTPDLNIITPRFDGQVVIIDTGMSAYYGSHRASLKIEGGRVTGLHGKQAVLLPTKRNEMVPYFETLADQMPDNQRLRAHLEVLRNPPTEADMDDLTKTVRSERALKSGE